MQRLLSPLPPALVSTADLLALCRLSWNLCHYVINAGYCAGRGHRLVLALGVFVVFLSCARLRQRALTHVIVADFIASVAQGLRMLLSAGAGTSRRVVVGARVP